jgi:competence protein ComEA
MLWGMNSFLDALRKLDKSTRTRYASFAALAAVVLGFWLSNASAPEVEGQQREVSNVLAPSVFQVHVAGAVLEPGLYELDSGARVSDAIAAAGGFSFSAIESSVNLARIISDGEQIMVLDETQLGEGSEYISLNSSSASELETLPGIGPATAKKIVDHRSKIGSFSSIEQITEVPGIGRKLLEQIRDQLTL